MKTLNKILLPIMVSLTVTGCASYNAGVYSGGLQQMATATGTVVALRRVHIAPRAGVGSEAGGLVGAAGGAMLARNGGVVGQLLGAAIGGLGGAVVGQKVQAATTGPALQVTVRLQHSGRLVSVVEQGYHLHLGERVGVTYSQSGKARVFPLSPAGGA